MDRLYWVRHGENLANLTKEFSSRRVDYSLTAKGVLQAEQTAEYFLDKDIQAIYSSPLKRGRETAKIIAARLGLQVIVLDELREIDVGDLELEPPSAENWAYHNRILQDWFTGQSESSFPNGENQLKIKARVFAAIQKMIAGRENQNIIAVSHGGCLMTTILDLSPSLTFEQLLERPLDNCSITELAISEADGHLSGEIVNWATIDHLTGEAANLVSGFPGEEEQ